MTVVVFFSGIAAGQSEVQQSAGGAAKESELETAAPGAAETDGGPAAAGSHETREARTGGSEREQAAGASSMLEPIDIGFGLPRVLVKGFGHVSYRADWVEPSVGEDTSTNQFMLGGLDLFVVSELLGGFSFLSEAQFGFEGDDAGFHMERLVLQYEFRDWLKLKFGRGHTAIGYWNQTFHHGNWLHTTVARPLLFEFEDGGGGLPMHFVGIEVLGNIHVARGMLSYAVTLSNGRGEEPEDVQVAEDVDDSKAVGVALRYVSHDLPGFGLGANFNLDRIPATADPARRRAMREYIYGLHVVYSRSPWVLIAEVQQILHDDRVADRMRRSAGAYGQIERRLGSWTPYYRFDWLSIADADPYFAAMGSSSLFQDTRQHTFGLRWDFRAFVALKLDYRYRDADSEDSHIVDLEASFAF